jgi:hypothetical protein
MDVTLEAEIYTPSVNNQGVYIDIVPYIRYGIRCQCSSRKDKIYNTKQTFITHTRTKTHIKWLEDMNNNRANFFVENSKLNDVIKTQQKIISKLETEVQNKSLTIDYLTKMLTIQNNNSNVDLLNID